MPLCVRQHLRSASTLLIATLVVATPLSRAAPDTWATLDHPDEVISSTTVREGDRLRTGWNGRLVIEVGPDRLKLDERTELVVRRLDPSGVALDLERGSIVLDLRRPERAWRWQVDSAAGRHQPHGAGLFRIDAPDSRQGLGSATAWRSALRIENEDGTLLLPPGQRAERDRQGRWQLGYPQADAFAAWSMGPMDRFPPDDRDGRDDRPPRHWQAAPSWEVQPARPYPLPPPPPRVIVVPAPIMVEPPPRHWRMQPEPRDRRPPPVSAPVQPARPVRPPDIAMPPPRPDRRHHEAEPALPAAPSSSPAMPRPQRAL